MQGGYQMEIRIDHPLEDCRILGATCRKLDNLFSFFFRVSFSIGQKASKLQTAREKTWYIYLEKELKEER